MTKQDVIFKITSIGKKLWLVCALSIIAWKGVVLGWHNDSTDFNNYYVASKLIANGEKIHEFYDNEWFKAKAKKMGVEAGAKFSPFPPITAYVYLPLTDWEPIVAKRIWLVLNVILLMILPFRIRKMTDWSMNNTLLFLSLFFIPITSCLNFGQLYLIIGFLLLEALGQLYFRNKPKLLGLVIGITASLKYLPVLFLAYVFNWKKRNLAIFWTAFTVIAFILFVHWQDSQAFSAFIQHFQSHLQGHLPGQGQYAIGFQSIDSLLNNLFVFNATENANPFIDFPLLKTFFKFLLLIIIGLVMFILYHKSKYKMSPILISIGLIGIYIAMPATASYHFLLLMWPMLSVFKWLDELKSIKMIVLVSVLAWIIFTVQAHHIPSINQYPTVNLLIHYPRFWGLLCLFVLLSLQFFKKSNIQNG